MNKINPNHTHFEMLQNIFNISLQFIDTDFQNQENLVFAEPYIPYIPNHWNGVLILSESQNLSSTHQSYVDKLSSMTSSERIQRLYDSKNILSLGIAPWDDGSLPLAVEAVLECDYQTSGVSNAVVWSKRGDSNQNPSKFMMDQSIFYYNHILPILQPLQIVTSGEQAKAIINQTMKNLNDTHATFQCKIFHLQHPSPSNLSRKSGMFKTEDLLRRYPEVQCVLDRQKELKKRVEEKYKKNKIFFSCHAVSLLR